MMIWFAGILQNTCCNRINENKTKKKHWVVCGVFTQFRAFTYMESHASDRVCFTANTQMTNFSFQVLVRRRSLFLIVLDSRSLFLLDWLGTHLFGRVLTRSHKLLFLPMTTFLDAFLKKRMAPPSWKPEGIANCRLEICIWVVRN